MLIPEKKVKALSDVRVICENPESRFNYFAWPTVARLPDGRLAMVSSGYRVKHCCPFGKAVISYSSDEGETWTKAEAFIDTPLDDRDAGIAVSGNRVILTSFNNTVAYQRQVNEEENKGNPELYALVASHLDTVDAPVAEKRYLGSLYVISEDGGKTFSEPIKVPVSCPHGPAVLPDGRFLYVGRVFGRKVGGDLPQLECWVENAEGTFEYLSYIPDVPVEIGFSCEPHTIVLPDGTILVHVRVQRFIPEKGAAGWEEFTLYQSESHDGGKTFSAPRPLLPTMGGAPSHLYRHSSGTLISAYAYREYVKELPTAVCVLLSHDDGKTWESRFLCDCVHNWDIGYPATVEKSDGTLLTVFYDHVKDGPAVIKQITWTLD